MDLDIDIVQNGATSVFYTNPGAGYQRSQCRDSTVRHCRLLRNLGTTNDFNSRMADFEAQYGSLFFDQNRDFRVVQFAHLVAAFADQELAGMGFARPPASDEGIQGPILCTKPCSTKNLAPCIRLAVPRSVCHHAALPECRKPRLGRVPDDLQHLPVQRREP